MNHSHGERDADHRPRPPSPGLRLLAELQTLLSRQLDLANDGDYESLEASARAARGLLDRLAGMHLENDLVVLDHLHQIRHLHGQLQQLLQQARNQARVDLNSARTGSSALRAYGQAW